MCGIRGSVPEACIEPLRDRLVATRYRRRLCILNAQFAAEFVNHSATDMTGSCSYWMVRPRLFSLCDARFREVSSPDRGTAPSRLRPVSPRPQSSRSSFWTELTDFAFVQQGHFRTDFLPPDQWSRRQAKTAFCLIHTPHYALLQARLRAIMATLLRSCFDSFSIRFGRARARARWGRGVGGRPGPGYVSNKRARKQKQGRSGHGGEGTEALRGDGVPFAVG